MKRVTHRNRFRRSWPIILATMLGWFAPPEGQPFSLLGPYKPWMEEILSYRQPEDIGGPMRNHEGYRWNVPVVTYGFDASFLDYFGPTGVDAVERAVRTLNDFPPASAVNLNDFPDAPLRQNYQATALHLLDLKTVTLGLLIEQMGLASPTRFVFTLRSRTVVTSESGNTTNYLITVHNYDPETWAPSRAVNGQQYSWEIRGWEFPFREDAVEYCYPPIPLFAPAVADQNFQAGQFAIGLSRDDVGGLRFLLRSNHTAWEHVLPGARSAGPDPSHFVDWAPRPGVEKITFQRLEHDPSGDNFQPLTNTFPDTFYTNGRPVTQMLQRIVRQPDILFSAQDFGVQFSETIGTPYFRLTPRKFFNRTDTSNWENNTLLTDGGPGIIRPPMVISFAKLGRYTSAYLDGPNCQTLIPNWAVFDGTTNAPVVLWGNETVSSIVLGTSLLQTNDAPVFECRLLGTYDATYRIEYTTDWSQWSPLATITNTENIFCIRDAVGPQPRYYRAVIEHLPWEPSQIPKAADAHDSFGH